jgi:hypothetical protein
MTEQHLPGLLRAFDPQATRRTVTGITGPLNLGAVSWSTVEQHAARADLRSQVALLTDLLSAHGTGLMVTLDEIHLNQLAELRELAITVQHAFRENREVAFVGAGLAASVSEVVNDSVLTFLRRAERHTLGRVPRTDVARALKEPIEASGRHVSDAALDLMVTGADGYPFLVQLVGAQTWRINPTGTTIGIDEARLGVTRAQQRLGTLVHEPALHLTSEVDRAFLRAMAHDDGPSRISDIELRMGVSASYVGQYRLRLIAAELIHAAARGYVDFSLPYFREFLRTREA